MGTSPHPVAAVIDSQSVKVASTVPRSTSGYDAGKKTPGRKRHIIVDLKGLPLFVMVTYADIHDSVAALEALFRLRLMHPEITIVWADLAHAGTLVDWARSFPPPDDQDREQAQGRQRVRDPAEAVGGREVTGVAVTRTPQCPGLRNAPRALRSDAYPGLDHAHGPPSHPACGPAERRHAAPAICSSSSLMTNGADPRSVPVSDCPLSFDLVSGWPCELGGCKDM